MQCFFRHILAICHFNENVKREKRKMVGGTTYYTVVFPKYKLGRGCSGSGSVPHIDSTVGSEIMNVLKD